jgi:hypothetical protein
MPKSSNRLRINTGSRASARKSLLHGANACVAQASLSTGFRPHFLHAGVRYARNDGLISPLLTGFISFRVFPWIPWPSSQAGSRPELSADAVFKANAYIALPDDSLPTLKNPGSPGTNLPHLQSLDVDLANPGPAWPARCFQPPAKKTMMPHRQATEFGWLPHDNMKRR